MPKIFEYLAYIIRFYRNDHLPIHVHVEIQNRESKVEFLISKPGDVVLIFKEIKGKNSLTKAEAKEVALFLKQYHVKIIEKWNQVFILHQKVSFEKISIRLLKKKH